MKIQIDLELMTTKRTLVDQKILEDTLNCLLNNRECATRNAMTGKVNYYHLFVRSIKIENQDTSYQDRVHGSES